MSEFSVGPLTPRDFFDETVGRLFYDSFVNGPERFTRIALLGWKPIDDIYPREIPEFSIGWRQQADTGRETEPALGMPAVSVSIRQTPSTLHITVDLSRLERDSVHIQVRDHILTLTGSQRAAPGQKPLPDLRSRRFRRSFPLPRNTRPGAVRARFHGEAVHITVARE